MQSFLHAGMSGEIVCVGPAEIFLGYTDTGLTGLFLLRTMRMRMRMMMMVMRMMPLPSICP